MAAFETKTLDDLIARYEGRGRDALLPLLHDVQSMIGWLPMDVQKRIGETLRVPLAEIHGVIEFYSMFYNQPTSKIIVRLCEDPSCKLAESERLAAAFDQAIRDQSKEKESNSQIRLEKVSCLGMCDQAPAALIGSVPVSNLTSGNAASLLESPRRNTVVNVFGRPRLMTERIGKIDPTDIDSYLDQGGFEVLHAALKLSPAELLKEVERCGILGRGGAMFPLDRKWQLTRAASGDVKYVVVNGDESEPGTFKDRYLMEEDPFAVIEAAVIAAYAIGAEKGWIFVRGEYPIAFDRLACAVTAAQGRSYLGRNILGSGLSFEIELRRGGGAYICGEETALFSAIEGLRGFPRIKPPFPVTHGLFGRPTSVNNVETLLAVLTALKLGSDHWRSFGTENSRGTKLFCVSGHVSRPGLYEMPFGVKVKELIEMAGGVVGGHEVQAVLMGGAAGAFIGSKDLDLTLSYEEAQLKKVPIGSGVVLVFNEHADLRQTLYELSRFFAHESCGKCFPCQLGTQRQMEILKEIIDGKKRDGGYLRDLFDIGAAMTETSLCGLGQTAASAIISAVSLFPELVE